MGFVISLPGCARKSELRAAAETGGPVQIIENSKLQLFDGARKVWVLESKHMRKSLGDTGAVVGYPVKLTRYDSTGATSTVCLADSGSTNDRKDMFSVWGNVYVKNQDGQIIRARKLRWDGKRHTVDSDDFVEVQTPTGDIIRGKGLDANESFSNWKLRQQASGNFPNFRMRMESEDGFDLGPAGDSTKTHKSSIDSTTHAKPAVKPAASPDSSTPAVGAPPDSGRKE